MKPAPPPPPRKPAPPGLKPPAPPIPALGRIVPAGGAGDVRSIALSPKIIIDPVEIRGKSFAFLGVNGSGKSTSARRMAEEHLRLGLPFTMCDIENEYPMLKELGEVVIAGPKITNMGGIKLDVQLTNTGHFHEMGKRAYINNLTVVLLLGDLDDEMRRAYLKAYLDGIFLASSPDNAHYYRVFLEECQEYIPQVGIDKKDPLRHTIIKFGKRGRKRHLSLSLISQRPSNVDKDVLTQCHGFVLHFVTYATDIEVYEKALGISKAADKMKMMAPGDAIYMFGRTYVEDRVLRPRTVSPWEIAGNVDTTNFKQYAQSEEIQKEITKEKDDAGTSIVPTAYLNKLERTVPELEKKLAAFVEENAGLEARIAELQLRHNALGNSTADEYIQQLQKELAEARKAAAPLQALADLIRRGDPHG